MANTKGSRFYTPEQLGEYLQEHTNVWKNKLNSEWQTKYNHMETSLTNRIHYLEEKIEADSSEPVKASASNSSEALMLLRESLQILNTITLQAISLMGEKKDA